MLDREDGVSTGVLQSLSLAKGKKGVIFAWVKQYMENIKQRLLFRSLIWEYDLKRGITRELQEESQLSCLLQCATCAWS